MRKEARYHLGLKLLKAVKLERWGKENDKWKWIVNESAQ